MEDKELMEMVQELKEMDVFHKKEFKYSSMLCMLISGVYTVLLLCVRLLTGMPVSSGFVYLADVMFVFNMIALPGSIKSDTEYNKIFCTGASYSLLMFALTVFVNVF